MTSRTELEAEVISGYLKSRYASMQRNDSNLSAKRLAARAMSEINAADTKGLSDRWTLERLTVLAEIVVDETSTPAR